MEKNNFYSDISKSYLKMIKFNKKRIEEGIKNRRRKLEIYKGVVKSGKWKSEAEEYLKELNSKKNKFARELTAEIAEI